METLKSNLKSCNVISIIVTYNRKKLLVECVEAVLQQTFPAKIVIIDNASTDGTFEYLIEKGFLDNITIEYYRLKENTGGAGGFYEGIKLAREMEPDWYWLMDDDTIPNQNCLEELLLAQDRINYEAGFLASCIESIGKEPMNIPQIDNMLTSNGYSNWQKYLYTGTVRIKAATFVSLLISKDSVEKCGLPCKDYFIWGDDTEYTMRISKYYKKGYLVGNSKACHKREGSKNLSLKEETEQSRIKNYFYLYRNGLINFLVYENKIQIAKEIICRVFLIFSCIKYPFAIKKICVILKGSFAGFVFYSHFKKYINSQIIKDSIDLN